MLARLPAVRRCPWPGFDFQLYCWRRTSRRRPTTQATQGSLYTWAFKDGAVHDVHSKYVLESTDKKVDKRYMAPS